jgi:phospholipase D1/2
MTTPILREGENCWRLPRADRVALLVDGADYFSALADAIERAERSVLMIGWDFHSQVRLRRGDDAGESALLALLERQVRRRRSLRVRILAWDFAMIYALEREWHPLFRFEKASHRRIRFHLDGRHPFGASQHQKIVVVDDAIAFSGGLDVTACRWDTRDHSPSNPLRSDPGFDGYGPFHDVQMAVDGAAARALGELARQRWQRATGRSLGPVRRGGDPWPPALEPRFRDVAVGISRTFPAYDGRPEVREVEALSLDSFRAARRLIYIENQYFTAKRVGDLLAQRLAEPDGPEVIVVLPSSLSGWLEKRTMGVLASRLTERLREADRHGRLRLLQPVLPESGTVCVHAKVAIVDDRFLRVGSANLANRSMGLDSECDLSIESTPERDLGVEIRRVRQELLAEHLGCSPEELADAEHRAASVGEAIDRLCCGDRRLHPVPAPEPGWLEQAIPDETLFDPERPIDFDELWPMFTAGRETPARARRRFAIARAVLGIAVVAALVAAWQLTPLGSWANDPEWLSGLASHLEQTPFGIALAVILLAITTSLLVPVTALIAACGMVFGFAKGSAIGLAGAVLGAALGYAAGRSLWREAVRRLAGSRLDRISRRLASRGVLAAAALRLVPIAPFGVVNLVAGASHIRARDFLLGTLLGMAPGALALAYFGDRALAVMRDPGWPSALAGVAVLAAFVALGRWVGVRLSGAGARRAVQPLP